jgi:hypothetical protein
MAVRNEVDAVAFGVTFLGVKDIYSADNSSPQTTEINAHKRAPTLMKWVNIAAVESGALVLLMTSAAPPGHKRWPFMGGVLALAITYSQYLYARNCGIQSMEPGTEDYGHHGTVSGRFTNATLRSRK